LGFEGIGNLGLRSWFGGLFEYKAKAGDSVVVFVIWVVRRVSWLSSSLSKSAYDSGVSRVVRLKVVIKTLKEGFRPLRMKEIKSSSSTGFPTAAN
jgi:hypothetical protein